MPDDAILYVTVDLSMYNMLIPNDENDTVIDMSKINIVTLLKLCKTHQTIG